MAVVKDWIHLRPKYTLTPITSMSRKRVRMMARLSSGMFENEDERGAG